MRTASPTVHETKLVLTSSYASPTDSTSRPLSDSAPVLGSSPGFTLVLQQRPTCLLASPTRCV